MKFWIEAREGYLHAEAQGRETPGDMREFLFAVKVACREHGCPRILLSVRASRPVFKLEEYGLCGFANDLVTSSCRIALLGDSSELNHAHEYVELVARQQQMNVKSFRDLASAQQWLREPEMVANPHSVAAKPAARSG